MVACSCAVQGLVAGIGEVKCMGAPVCIQTVLVYVMHGVVPLCATVVHVTTTNDFVT